MTFATPFAELSRRSTPRPKGLPFHSSVQGPFGRLSYTRTYYCLTDNPRKSHRANHSNSCGSERQVLDNEETAKERRKLHHKRSQHHQQCTPSEVHHGGDYRHREDPYWKRVRVEPRTAFTYQSRHATGQISSSLHHQHTEDNTWVSAMIESAAVCPPWFALAHDRT